MTETQGPAAENDRWPLPGLIVFVFNCMLIRASARQLPTETNSKGTARKKDTARVYVSVSQGNLPN